MGPSSIRARSISDFAGVEGLGQAVGGLHGQPGVVEVLVSPPAAEPPAVEFATKTGAAGGIGVESIELCSGVEARACVGGKREFAPGEMVWALLRLTNDTQAETEVRVSYLEEGGAPAPGRC